MIYGSVCSGIEAATVAWHPLGWRAAFFSEIEAFPSALLSHYYPDVPNHGDMTKFKEWPNATIDVLVGGTPCQSFSVAGLRKGLDDPRGNLTLVYLAIAARYRPRWVVWENVPGVLSDKTGAFGAFLGGLGELGYGFAYRVLDAQYFGVPQRRRRVFVVGCLGDWRRAAAVLFERHSLQGNPAPRRETRKGSPNGAQEDARGDGFGTDGSLMRWPAEVASTLNAAFGDKQGLEDQHALHGAPLFVPHIVGALTAKGPGSLGAPEVDAGHYIMSSGQTNASITKEVTGALDCLHEAPIVANATNVMQVRRLTPRECERLQGFPDDYTLIPYRNKPAADGPRYKALGNSMAVPVMRWIGERIAQVDAIKEQQDAA